MLIITDNDPPIEATALELAGALATFDRRTVLETQGELGRFTVAWRDMTRCITQEHPDGSFRTSLPLDSERIFTILKKVLDGDPAWEAGVGWFQLPPRQRVINRTLAMVLVPMGLSISWLVIVIAWLPRLLYSIPHCRAYAATHGYTFMAYVRGTMSRYESENSTPAACVMAEGRISFNKMMAKSPPLSTLEYLLFERLIFQTIMMFVLVGLILGLIYWNKNLADDGGGDVPVGGAGPQKPPFRPNASIANL